MHNNYSSIHTIIKKSAETSLCMSSEDNLQYHFEQPGLICNEHGKAASWTEMVADPVFAKEGRIMATAEHESIKGVELCYPSNLLLEYSASTSASTQVLAYSI